MELLCRNPGLGMVPYFEPHLPLSIYLIKVLMFSRSIVVNYDLTDVILQDQQIAVDVYILLNTQLMIHCGSSICISTLNFFNFEL